MHNRPITSIGIGLPFILWSVNVQRNNRLASGCYVWACAVCYSHEKILTTLVDLEVHHPLVGQTILLVVDGING